MNRFRQTPPSFPTEGGIVKCSPFPTVYTKWSTLSPGANHPTHKKGVSLAEMTDLPQLYGGCLQSLVFGVLGLQALCVSCAALPHFIHL